MLFYVVHKMYLDTFVTVQQHTHSVAISENGVTSCRIWAKCISEQKSKWSCL